MQILLDGVDVTAEIKRQLGSAADDDLHGALPAFLPAKANVWFDMLKLINSSAALREKFFDAGSLHTLTVRDMGRQTFNVKMLARTTYSVRNS